jgi:hypothetical protein
MTTVEADPQPTSDQLQKLRERLQAMSRRELQKLGRIARHKCRKTASASLWDMIELREATEEWRRRERSKTRLPKHRESG